MTPDSTGQNLCVEVLGDWYNNFVRLGFKLISSRVSFCAPRYPKLR
jgi:hypothetical protein